MEARVGERPGVVREQVKTPPQIPPVVTSTRAHEGPGSSGSGISAKEAGKSGSDMSNSTARISLERRRGGGAAHREPVA